MEREAEKAIRDHDSLPEQYEQMDKSNMKEISQSKANFLHQILASRLPKEEKASQRMGEEAFSIIAAGGETIARTLTTATYHLLSNPTTLERLRRELRELQPNPHILPEVKQLEHLPWLVSHSKEIVSMR